MNFVQTLENKILEGHFINKEEARLLSILDETNLYQLFSSAAHIRDVRTGKKVDLCSIINAKSGNCSEDCKYCAQSSHYKSFSENYPLLNEDVILSRALELQKEGAKRFSLVMSGKGINNSDFLRILEIYDRLGKETDLKLCASLGIISEEKALSLKQAGVSTYHHNLETSENYFSNICTTHSYHDRIGTIKNAQSAGLEICSGGILSMGETMEDRLEMAFALRELGVTSVPINILNPIKGTPLEEQTVIPPMEILKTISIYRFILPDAMLRLAGGSENALRSLRPLSFLAGISACLVGNYLTTTGGSIANDLQTIKDMELYY